jgi:hypothetical protein
MLNLIHAAYSRLDIAITNFLEEVISAAYSHPKNTSDSSEKIKISVRVDKQLEMFPFEEGDRDVEEYGHALSMYLNNLFPKLKDSLNRNKEHSYNGKITKTGGILDEYIEKKRSAFASYKTAESNSRIKSCMPLLPFSIKSSRDVS